jgi:hypothetical protein
MKIIVWDERPESNHWGEITEAVASMETPVFYSLEENGCEAWGVLIISMPTSRKQIYEYWREWNLKEPK